MKTREEQIVEMAKVMCEEYDTDICKHECPMATDCANTLIAKRLIAAGYRKQSDTVREILQKLIYNITANNTNDGYLSESIDYSSTIEDIKELAAQYGVEVEE